ncbi:MAG: YigZ family protein [Veillonellaceae bacterium]|uniref:YigZ family protein n=1 Tax=Anaerovibrio lipolyticus TaxID=82374 RepID=UPI001F18232A|nr:YigZ family protein [Anaerovibrio lipolyticus]MCI6909891.1 YigZ family protein [Veillonellaceae bacterium]MDY4484810.1 YigZ family protein [Anaerovibrio sp.]MCF2601634.1 YigZ family protein [Anaerovibrio lipolyticus]MCI7078553.1 YigZ family protein [Veillonellaceae bacterium]MCI7234916.1 YigZ family protein [Veillonellaceae bacterium]
MHIYKTTAENGTASYEIQKSRFIAYTSHVETEAEARDFVAAIKKKHFDARHNCSAWVLGADSSQQKSNDDGEPGGTAGNPILEAIKQHGLTNVVVVVTRYFGGIKLGAGGLIRAYSHTASLGLEATPCLEVKPFCLMEAEMDYSLLGTVENWIRNEELRTGETAYLDKVTVRLLVEPADCEAISTELTNLTAAQCKITIHKPEYMSLPI